MLRAAKETDFDFLRGFPNGPSDEQIRSQIRSGRLRIIESASTPVLNNKYVIASTKRFQIDSLHESKGDRVHSQKGVDERQCVYHDLSKTP